MHGAHTIYSSIEKHITEVWVYSGEFARMLAPRLGIKESNCERRMRELAEEGILERRLVDNPTRKGSRVTQYRLKPLLKVIEERKWQREVQDNPTVSLFS